MQACRQCHENIYSSFIRTGMGSSFDTASAKKTSANFKSAGIYDQFKDLHYRVSIEKDLLRIHEYRLSGKDTLHKRTEQIHYIIGSGQHTNSHLYSVNGYLYQMPMTFYTQKQKWDLPPGFENGVNTRFSRKIGIECMSCHNAFPEFETGSENKYKSVPKGIDCERCHGPGSIHVSERMTSERIDTSKFIDRSIVNPAKLSAELQFDICQRCHLQGNAVLKEGKSFYDFKPGMKLNDFISVFLPKYKNGDEDFIMASHADRLKQSACFIRSAPDKNDKSLKPYKNALTCVTCHNPHVSVKETDKNSFNNACLNCHKEKPALAEKFSSIEKKHEQAIKGKTKFTESNCVSCHMPLSGSIDIPHVSVHDHYIRKPISKTEIKKIKEFIGLFSVNENNPSEMIRAKAYLQQYEQFEGEIFYLDSAENILKRSGRSSHPEELKLMVQLQFFKKNYSQLLSLIGQNKEIIKKQLLTQKSKDNSDAWTCYRIAESFYQLNDVKNSQDWFQSAVMLAPSNLEFRSKYALSLASNGNLPEAEKEYEKVLVSNPKYAPAYSNLGYLKMSKGLTSQALSYYLKGLSLDPDNESLLLNLSAYYLFVKDKRSAMEQLKKIIKINPGNQKAKEAIQYIQTH